jgi:hypothetical protein
MADPLHIKNGTLTVDAIELRIRGGTLTPRTPGVVISDSGSGGAREYLPGGGLEEWDLVFSAYYRPQDPFTGVTGTPGTPPKLRPGRIVPVVLTLMTGITYTGNIYIEECPADLGTVDGTQAIVVSVTAHGSGPLTYPAIAPGP